MAVYEQNPTINVMPDPSLFDQVVHIYIKGLPERRIVTLHSHCTVKEGLDMECISHYRTNKFGCIDLKNDKSIGGSYTGIEPMGLFFGLRESADNTGPFAHQLRINPRVPFNVSIHVYDAVIDSLQEISKYSKSGVLKDLELVRRDVTRKLLVDSTSIVSYTKESHGFKGTLFLPPGNGPFPAVMTLGGGFGAIYENKAAQLSCHGFAGLALQVFFEKGSMESPINLDFVEAAVKTLRNHPKVDGKCGMGVIGISATSYLALAISELLEGIKCAVWINGTIQATFYDIKYKDQLIPQVQLDWDKAGTTDEGWIVLKDCHPKVLEASDLSSKRPTFQEKHDTAYLFIVGLDDNTMPADDNANLAEKLLASANHPNYEVKRYSGAGHVIFPPFTASPRTLPSVGYYTSHCDHGGDIVLHSRAQEDAWIRQLKFLKANLTD